MEQIIVNAAPRETRGKNAARRVRLTGQVPAVIYGGKGGSMALEVNAKQVSAILRSPSGHNTIFKIKVKDAEETAIVKDWIVDPVKGHLLHVDLLRIAMDVRMRVKIPVHTFGEAQGVKLERPYTKVDSLGIAIAFIRDPWGTYIELTEGLDKVA